MSGTVRQQKFASVIQKELSGIFQRDRKGILEREFITITEVQMSPDLSVARIYISMMLAKDKGKLLDRINLRKKEIRKELGEKISKQVRIIPELAFFIDEVEEHAVKMDQLIDSLHIPPVPEEEKPRKKKKD